MASAEVPRPEAYQFLRDWQRTLFDAGFVGLTWPKEYGGRGLTFMEELILHEEMALAKAPQILNILGVGMAGPRMFRICGALANAISSWRISSSMKVRPRPPYSLGHVSPTNPASKSVRCQSRRN